MKIKYPHGLMLVMLVIIFAAPGLSALYVYKHPDILGNNRTNRGSLLNPPVLITKDKAHYKWKLLLWSPTACERNCEQQLDKLARIRLALGRRLYDLELCLLLSDNAPNLSTTMAKTLHERDVRVLKQSLHETNLLSALSKQAVVYLENPEGYAVLSYPLAARSEDIFHDIKKILKS